jgi:hypothetical protein
MPQIGQIWVENNTKSISAITVHLALSQKMYVLKFDVKYLTSTYKHKNMLTNIVRLELDMNSKIVIVYTFQISS